MKTNEPFVEVDCRQQQKSGNEICGDVFLSKKIPEENRTIVVLSDGLGSGVKANILASMTASMALNFIKVHSPIGYTAKIIMNTLPVDNFRKISYSTFTIMDIEGNRKVKLIEFGNPAVLIRRKGSFFTPEKSEISIKSNIPAKQRLFTSEFEIGLDDRIIFFTDGVTQSGMGNKSMPFGWGRQNLCQYVEEMLQEKDDYSAEEVAHGIVKRAVKNDHHTSRDDISCGVVYFRRPRKVLFCTGPPFKEENDRYLAEQIAGFPGQVIISGGTTAWIAGRELNREINVCLDSYSGELPPESEMKGADLITEGILTLGKVSEYLQKLNHLRDPIPGPAGKIIRYFHDNDEIRFLVGTRVNEAHQDPNLPVELAIRRNVVKKIGRLLEENFLKKVEIKYI